MALATGGIIMFPYLNAISYLKLCHRLVVENNQALVHNAILHSVTNETIEDITWPHTDIQNFSLSVEKYFTRSLHSLMKYFFNIRREISYLQAAM